MNTHIPKIIIIGTAVIVSLTSLILILQQYAQNNVEEQRLQKQQELHKQAIGDTSIKKSRPFNVMDYAKPPRPTDK